MIWFEVCSSIHSSWHGIYIESVINVILVQISSANNIVLNKIIQHIRKLDNTSTTKHQSGCLLPSQYTHSNVTLL